MLCFIFIIIVLGFVLQYTNRYMESFSFREHKAEYDKPFNYYRYAGKNIKCYSDVDDVRNSISCKRILDDYKYTGRKCDNHFGSRCPDAGKCFDAICKGDKMKFFTNECHKLEYPYENEHWNDAYDYAANHPDAAFDHLKRFRVDANDIGHYEEIDYDDYANRMSYDGQWNENNNLKLVMNRNLKCPGLRDWPKPYPHNNQLTYGGKNAFHMNNIYRAWKTQYEKPQQKCEALNEMGIRRKESCNHGSFVKDANGNYKPKYNNACDYIDSTLPAGKRKCLDSFSWDIKNGRYYHCELNGNKCSRAKLPCMLTDKEQCRTDACFTSLCKPIGLSRPDKFNNMKDGEYESVLNNHYNNYRCEELYDTEDLRKSIQSVKSSSRKTPWQIARSCIDNSDECVDENNNDLSLNFDIEDASALLTNDSTYRVINASLKDHYKDKDIKKTLKCSNVKNAADYSWPLKWEYGNVVLSNYSILPVEPTTLNFHTPTQL